ncbi:MAG: DUF1553 domain-containing protein [Planctomycetes bacterium]|nr:DUF1553 domain-containing protein [Planctomycetota bacterium]
MMHLSVALAVLAMSSARLGADDVDYLKQVKPLLTSRCGSCHGPLAQKAKLRLDTAAFIKGGGRSGPAIIAGKSDESLMIHAILGRDRPRMPPRDEGKALAPAEIAVLKRWIDAGAPAPKNEVVPSDPRKHWAFQKPVRPAIPRTDDLAWQRHPIDSFIRVQHDRLGLKALPPADRATLLRRVTLDLTGLPPTREQLHAFLADASPAAFDRVVERLLASPDYGERWARHWMDVWRYSDWYGRRSENDWRNSSPTLWRWRDWIVGSLNAGRGYDRMIQEMLAADEIVPDNDAAQAATGFLVRNYYSLNHDSWMKDQVEHTAKAFLGLTLNCCHCHDHKYDPISQEEYFRFRAFFEPLGLRQDRVPGEPDPGPFQKYGYGGSGKVVTSGLVRVMDERFDAKTRMYRLGNDRDFMADRLPVTPGAPAMIGGDRLQISPVMLPSTAVYPGAKKFIQDEEIAAAEKELAAARTVQPADPSRLSVAEARLKAVHAVIAADRAKYKLGPGDAVDLARIAARAQALLRLSEARRRVDQVERELALAKGKQVAAAIKKAEDALATAKKQCAAAESQVAVPQATYVPLSPTYPATSTGRRKALALWITSSDNPLTARVAVNHIWLRHFGKPLVESVFDFGRNGKSPTHPELLDWLAVELMESGWNMKRLHKLIVTSQTYQLQSAAAQDDANLAKDADDRWLWRYPSRRLEAEAVRDAMLFTAGDLDARTGGKEIEPAQEKSSRRRSLYFASHPEGGGSLKLLEFFDAPDPCDCYRRAESLVPQQALALTNSEFTIARSRSLADRWLTGSQESSEAMIVRAFEDTLTRRPKAEELKACMEFLESQSVLVAKHATPQVARQRAWESLARVLFNHHEFVTIR